VKRRTAAVALLALAVLALHGLTVSWLARQLAQSSTGEAAQIHRMDIAFVRELQPSQPPAAVVIARSPTPRSRRAPEAVAAPASAASAAQESAGQPAPDTAPPPVPDPPAAWAEAMAQADALAQAAAGEMSPAAPPPSAALAAATAGPAASAADDVRPPAQTDASPVASGAASAASAGAADAVAFEWPPSTRLSYTLFGDYRGPVHGSARVEWLRRDDRYQVHLEVSVGVLVSRRLSSEGLLTADGLQPLRYEEVTQALLGEPRRLSVRFEQDRIVLADGRATPTLAHVQDTASQFVQLTWLFTTRRELLRAGQSIEVPLALPHRVDRWIYDVQPEEDVDTPVGRVRAFHVKPRRTAPPPGALLVESWFAPSLQYLPVRILIRRDAQTYVDLTLSRLPQQEAAPRPGTEPR
jgi:hypothetical protein